MLNNPISTRFWIKPVTILAILINSATAEEAEPSLMWDGGKQFLMAGFDGFLVEVSDQVKGGCLTNVDAIRTAVELTIRRNGFVVYPADQSFYRPTITVTFVGYSDRTVGGRRLGCIASTDLELSKYLIVHGQTSINSTIGDTPTLANLAIWKASGVMSGGNLLNSRARTWAIESTETLINDIFSARENMSRKFPDMKTFYDGL